MTKYILFENDSDQFHFWQVLEIDQDRNLFHCCLTWLSAKLWSYSFIKTCPE